MFAAARLIDCVASVAAWLQERRHLPLHEIKAKYPMGLERGSELPEFLHPMVHRGRLGAEIDKVLGLNESSEAETVGTRQSRARFSLSWLERKRFPVGDKRFSPLSGTQDPAVDKSVR
jgi:hypothetical protein